MVVYGRAGDSTRGVKDEKGLWLACRNTGDSTGGRAPRPCGNAVSCSFEQSDVGSLPIIETQKSSYWIEKTTSLSATLVFDPARFAHLPGIELKIDSLFLRKPFDAQIVFPKCFFPLPLDAAQALILFG